MNEKELTVKQLEEMSYDKIFAKGEIIDSPQGLNMSNSKGMLRWIAVRGAVGDWAIYCHWADKNWEWINRLGDKVYDKRNIKMLVPCTDEAFRRYRY